MSSSGEGKRRHVNEHRPQEKGLQPTHLFNNGVREIYTPSQHPGDLVRWQLTFHAPPSLVRHNQDFWQSLSLGTQETPLAPSLLARQYQDLWEQQANSRLTPFGTVGFIFLQWRHFRLLSKLSYCWNTWKEKVQGKTIVAEFLLIIAQTEKNI